MFDTTNDTVNDAATDTVKNAQKVTKMKHFEIHITGEEGIIEELTSMKLKNITVELLRPDNSTLRTEFMSSIVRKFNNYSECAFYVQNLTNNLKSKIIRVKIESPFYDEFVDQSLYMESHFAPFNSTYPLSRNKASGKLMATDREYDKEKYNQFKEVWKDNELELCLFDSFVKEDSDWFELYKK